MSYPFPPDLRDLIHAHMAGGAYSSEDELLRDALMALDQQTHAVIEEDSIVVEGIRRGLADMKAGRSRPFDEFNAEFRAKHNIP